MILQDKACEDVDYRIRSSSSSSESESSEELEEEERRKQEAIIEKERVSAAINHKRFNPFKIISCPPPQKIISVMEGIYGKLYRHVEWNAMSNQIYPELSTKTYDFDDHYQVVYSHMVEWVESGCGYSQDIYCACFLDNY